MVSVGFSQFLPVGLRLLGCRGLRLGGLGCALPPSASIALELRRILRVDRLAAFRAPLNGFGMACPMAEHSPCAAVFEMQGIESVLRAVAVHLAAVEPAVGMDALDGQHATLVHRVLEFGDAIAPIGAHGRTPFDRRRVPTSRVTSQRSKSLNGPADALSSMNRLREETSLDPIRQERRPRASRVVPQDLINHHHAGNHGFASSASAAARTATGSKRRYRPRTTTGNLPARA